MADSSIEEQQSDIRMTKLQIEVGKAIEKMGNGCSHLEVISVLEAEINLQLTQARREEIAEKRAFNVLEEMTRGHFFEKNSRTCRSDTHLKMAGGSSMNCWKANYNEFMRDTS